MAEPTMREVDDFIRTNDIDERAAADLRNCSSEIQRKVLARGELSTARNPSAALLARIRDARSSPSAGGSASMEVEDFIKNNDVDESAADMLRSASPGVQRAVLARGELRTARNPSSALLSRIRDAKLGVPGGSLLDRPAGLPQAAAGMGALGMQSMVPAYPGYAAYGMGYPGYPGYAGYAGFAPQADSRGYAGMASMAGMQQMSAGMGMAGMQPGYSAYPGFSATPGATTPAMGQTTTTGAYPGYSTDGSTQFNPYLGYNTMGYPMGSQQTGMQNMGMQNMGMQPNMQMGMGMQQNMGMAPIQNAQDMTQQQPQQQQQTAGHRSRSRSRSR